MTCLTLPPGVHKPDPCSRNVCTDGQRGFGEHATTTETNHRWAETTPRLDIVDCMYSGYHHHSFVPRPSCTCDEESLHGFVVAWGGLLSDLRAQIRL